jgi:hypothetical protein
MCRPRDITVVENVKVGQIIVSLIYFIIHVHALKVVLSDIIYLITKSFFTYWILKGLLCFMHFSEESIIINHASALVGTCESTPKFLLEQCCYTTCTTMMLLAISNCIELFYLPALLNIPFPLFFSWGLEGEAQDGTQGEHAHLNTNGSTIHDNCTSILCVTFTMILIYWLPFCPYE